MVFQVSCASFTPMSEYEKQAVAPHQQAFVDLSNGRVTLEEVKEISIYIKQPTTYNSITKKFEASTGDYAGICYPMFKTIVVNKWWWELSSHLSRKHLIIHELGHCLLLKQHTSPTSIGGIGGI